jgi:hypothetical protein
MLLILLNLIYISYLNVLENGEPCFENIDVDYEHTAGRQITVSSAHPKQILSETKDSYTSWIPDITDMTPWILVC